MNLISNIIILTLYMSFLLSLSFSRTFRVTTKSYDETFSVTKKIMNMMNIFRVTIKIFDKQNVL